MIHCDSLELDQMSYKSATAEWRVAVSALGFESYGETTSLINITEDTASELAKQKWRSARPNMAFGRYAPYFNRGAGAHLSWGVLIDP